MRIDQEFKNLIPPLSESEYSLLEKEIIADGIRTPVDLWDDVIVDGHNRYEIATKHGLGCPSKGIEFQDKRAARIWIRKNQMARRNITDAWRIELELQNKAELVEIGKEKQGERTDLLSLNDKKLEPAHNTQKAIATTLKMSTGKKPIQKLLEAIENEQRPWWKLWG